MEQLSTRALRLIEDAVYDETRDSTEKVNRVKGILYELGESLGQQHDIRSDQYQEQTA